MSRHDRMAATPPAGLVGLYDGFEPWRCALRGAWMNASAWSVLYGGAPVYLVGGAARDPRSEPRDIDIVVVLTNAQFEARYGGTIAEFRMSHGLPTPLPVWRRWARDCAKRNAFFAEHYRVAFDFKTEPLYEAAKHAREPRIRLDCGILAWGEP